MINWMINVTIEMARLLRWSGNKFTLLAIKKKKKKSIRGRCQRIYADFWPI